LLFMLLLVHVSVSLNLWVCSRLLYSGLFGAASSLVGVSFLRSNSSALAVALITLSSTMYGVARCGFFVNHIDIAPPYAGTLIGIANGVASTSGFIAPLVAAVLTTDVSRSFIILFYNIILIRPRPTNCILGNTISQVER